MTSLQNYLLRIFAALLLWLGLVLWGSAAICFFFDASTVAIQHYQIIANALSPMVIVWAFWVEQLRHALGWGAGIALCGALALEIMT